MTPRRPCAHRGRPHAPVVRPAHRECAGGDEANVCGWRPACGGEGVGRCGRSFRCPSCLGRRVESCCWLLGCALRGCVRTLRVRDAFDPRPNTYTRPRPGAKLFVCDAARLQQQLELAKGRAQRRRAVVYVPSCVLALYSLPRSPPRAAARCAQLKDSAVGREREGAKPLQLPYCVSRAMAKPKTQWPKSSAAMPFVAPAESRWYRSWIS